MHNRTNTAHSRCISIQTSVPKRLNPQTAGHANLCGQAQNRSVGPSCGAELWGRAGRNWETCQKKLYTCCRGLCIIYHLKREDRFGWLVSAVAWKADVSQLLCCIVEQLSFYRLYRKCLTWEQVFEYFKHFVANIFFRLNSGSRFLKGSAPDNLFKRNTARTQQLLYCLWQY